MKEKDMSKGKNKEEKKETKVIEEETLVRIFSTDIPGNKKVHIGLTKIKGISWSLANAICNILKIEKEKKIKELSGEEIKSITNVVNNPKGIPKFLFNRRRDLETGEDKHLIGTDLELTKEFDIKRLKKIRSYRGLRHAIGQPVRGQRTRSHFRKNKTVGVQKKKGRKSGK